MESTIRLHRQYRVQHRKGRGIVVPTFAVNDANGAVIDCRIVSGLFRNCLGTKRIQGDVVCLRPGEGKWKPIEEAC